MASSIRKLITQSRGSRARIARVVVALAFAITYTAACDVHGLSEPGTLSTLSISPDPKTLQINGTQQFTAIGKDFSGANVAVDGAQIYPSARRFD